MVRSERIIISNNLFSSWVKKLRCIHCSGLNTKRRGVRKNKYGTVQRAYCYDCEESFRPSALQKKRAIVRRHLEDHSSYRTIARRNGVAKRTAIKVVHRIAHEVRDSTWIAKNLRPKWSGVLGFDGTYLRVRNEFIELARANDWGDERFLQKLIALLSVDYHTRDLPHYSLGDNENLVDLVMHFQILKENGYPLDVLIRDGNADIETAARHVYATPFGVQQCQYHFLDKFDRALAERGNSVKECESIRYLKNQVCSIICTDDIDTAITRMNIFVREQNRFRTSAVTDELTTKFIRDFEHLTMYLQYPKGYVPRTVNFVENINKQLKDRTKPMCMFQTVESAEDYLKLWCLKRRFQKFTDCKKPHEGKNGKAPLELAGCEIYSLDYLNL